MRSIRWQLPLSYAAIALLAALAIGALMLARLNEYYLQRERSFLQNNALAVQASLIPLSVEQLPAEVLQAQVQSMAIFTRSRVRLYDLQGVVLADSGEISTGLQEVQFLSVPENMIISGGAVSDQNIIVFNQGSVSLGAGTDTIQAALIGETATGTGVTGIQEPIGQVITSSSFATLPVFSVFSAGYLGEEDLSLGRSAESMTVPMLDSAGQTVGQITVSEGPAYGRDVVNSAAQAWLIAGLAGVLLAALAGWWVSQRVSRPVLELAQVTGRMAQGDLSVRAEPSSTLEFDTLSSTFNQMAERVEDTVATLRNFAADAAHELKTPLTALRTNLELAQTAELYPANKRLEYLERTQAQVQHLEHLVTDLLDLARLESGAIKPVALDLNALLRETSETYAAQAEQAGLGFSLALPENPQVVRGDAAQLLLAVGNLLDNAIKFTPAGGEVCLGAQHTEGNTLIWVEDTGPGIAAEDREGLFARFHRGRNTSHIPGSGLGLAIVQAVAHAHGGRVRGENRPQGGARFEIILP